MEHLSEQETKEVTILVVDDDDIDYQGIKRAMHKLKILNPVVRAHDGVEALDLLRSESAVGRPYLILLDLNMPRMGGIEMLEELRKDDLLNTAVVFVLTTSKAEGDRVKAYSYHVAGYLVKEQIETGFEEIVAMLENYWRIVELPVNN